MSKRGALLERFATDCALGVAKRGWVSRMVDAVLLRLEHRCRALLASLAGRETSLLDPEIFRTHASAQRFEHLNQTEVGTVEVR